MLTFILLMITPIQYNVLEKYHHTYPEEIYNGIHVNISINETKVCVAFDHDYDTAIYWVR